MTDYPYLSCRTLTAAERPSRGCTAVIPVVVPRRSRVLLSARSTRSFRLRREGTDPASRGRGGERRQPGGDTA